MSDRKLPTLAEIEQRAYELYVALGREDGHAVEGACCREGINRTVATKRFQHP
jgi:Protein of unknown function (DUF2934)